ncbi:MAG: ABC transporter ATP-binding protein [Acidobacteria bacterium]|nr:ABC transporter ATP-binding protein [Acidobacteriota bacterium]
MEASGLSIDIEKRLATFDLRVRLEVGAEILVLFGPSGAGKTQTLNAVAGLTTPDAGEIVLGGDVFFRSGQNGNAFNLPPRRRRVGYVFQQYALFPHMTALENVAYALWRQPGARARAEELLGRMHLERLAGRYPHELSGGQQQRVAIARALAMRPRVLLMDEPFSALDSPTRQRLHQDLIDLQREERLIVVYVTHNLSDAFAVGHRLAIMREGRIEQVGVPEDVRRNPANPLVLAALGLPAEWPKK